MSSEKTAERQQSSSQEKEKYFRRAQLNGRVSVLLFGLSTATLFLSFTDFIGIPIERHLFRSFKGENVVLFGLTLYSFLFLIFIWFVHRWSVFSAEFQSLEIGHDEKNPCRYCGNEKAGLVCPDCESVQWDPDNILRFTGVYFAHHRHKILTALLAVGLIGPISFGYTKYGEELDKSQTIKATYENDVKLLMNSILSVRSALHEIGISLKSDIKTGSTSTKFDNSESLTGISSSFYNVSWFGSRVIDFLNETTCLEYQDCQICKGKKHSSTQCKSCRFIRKESMKLPAMEIIDKAYLDFRNAFDSYVSSPSEVKGKHLMSRIKRLFESLMSIGCVIAELSFNQWLDSSSPSRVKIYDCKDCLDTVNSSGWRNFKLGDTSFPWTNP